MLATAVKRSTHCYGPGYSAKAKYAKAKIVDGRRSMVTTSAFRSSGEERTLESLPRRVRDWKTERSLFHCAVDEAERRRMLYFPSPLHRGFAERLNSRVPDLRESMTVVGDGKPTGRGRGKERKSHAARGCMEKEPPRRGLSEMARA